MQLSRRGFLTAGAAFGAVWMMGGLTGCAAPTPRASAGVTGRANTHARALVSPRVHAQPSSWTSSVVEPDAPGAEEQVVSLYHTLDADALHAHADEVKRLFAQNTALRSRAARYIASAGSLLLDSRRAEACSANFEKVRRVLQELGIDHRAHYVERATMGNQRIVPLDEVEPMSSPYFSMIVIPGEKWRG